MSRNTIDTSNLKVGQDQSHDILSTGKLDRNEFFDEFETVDTPDWKDKAKAAAFYEEEVEIVISETDNPNAEHLIQLGVNGVNQFLVRGMPTIIKRKFVEGLCRARPGNVTTNEFIDPNGNRSTRVNTTFGLKYPFRVLRDSNPNGHAWLERVLREA